MAEEKKGKSAKDDKFSKYPLIQEFINSTETPSDLARLWNRSEITRTEYAKKELKRIERLKEIYYIVLKPLQDSKDPLDQALLDEMLIAPNAAGACILQWSFEFLRNTELNFENFSDLLSFSAFLDFVTINFSVEQLGFSRPTNREITERLYARMAKTPKHLLKKDIEEILNLQMHRLIHLSPEHIKNRRKTLSHILNYNAYYDLYNDFYHDNKFSYHHHNDNTKYHPKDNTLLHVLAKVVSSKIFIAFLDQISSDLITCISPLLDATDKTVFYLVGRCKPSEIIREFIKKIDVPVLIEHFPDLETGRSHFIENAHRIRNGQFFESFQLFGKPIEKIKTVGDLSAALVNYILKDTENALQYLKTLRDDDHPSWFSLYIKGYQTAYKTLQKSKQADMAKSDLLLATMFHLSNRNFRIKRTDETDALLFDTLKLMLDRPASVIVGIMRAENNPQDITNVIELLKVYYNSLTEGAEKTKVRLKMLDYAEQLPKRQNKRVEEKKNSSDVGPLIPEEKETMEDAIISTTKEEEAAVTAVLHACNLEIPDEDLSLKEMGTAITFKLVAAKKQELMLKENGQIFESIIEKIQFHLLLTDLESTSFLNWFRNMWRRFFPPPKSEADYFKEFVSFTVKDKLLFVSTCIEEMETVNRTSTTFKALFKALKTNLEERRALLPEKLQKSATQSGALFLKVFKTDKKTEEKSTKIKTDQKPTNF